jgi:hypothetical protein
MDALAPLFDLWPHKEFSSPEIQRVFRFGRPLRGNGGVATCAFASLGRKTPCANKYLRNHRGDS